MRIPTPWLRWGSAAALFIGASMAQAQEIKFWTLNFANNSANRAFQSIVKQFEASNPGVTIKVEQRGTDEHKSALRVASGSNQAPDIYFMWAGLGLGGEFVKSGLALNMEKYYAEYKWDDRFLPVALSFSKDYPPGRYGVPYTFKGEALYYNKALFQKAGITSEPKTYDELVADAEKLAKAGIPAITFGGTVNWHLMRLMDELLETKCGPEKHDALMKMKVSWAEEPCATKAFEELHLWTSKYTLKPFMGIDQLQSFNLFLAGRAAMMLEGDWLVGQLRDAKRLPDFGVFPFPTGTERLYGFAEYNYVSTKSKKSRRRGEIPRLLVVDAGPAGPSRRVRHDLRQQTRQVHQHRAARRRLAQDLWQLRGHFRQRRPGLPSDGHHGILADNQPGRERQSRSEGRGRGAAEVHRVEQIDLPSPGSASIKAGPFFAKPLSPEIGCREERAGP